MDRMELNDNLEGTVIGNNKFIMIPMKTRDIVEFDTEEYTEFYNLFKNINRVEEAIDILMESHKNNINGNNFYKAIINLINANEDNIETIFNFLLYIATEEMEDLKVKYNDLIIKSGNQFYNSGMSDAKHVCSCEKEEVKENETTYNSYESPEVLFNNDEEPEFEIVPHDEAEVI